MIVLPENNIKASLSLYHVVFTIIYHGVRRPQWIKLKRHLSQLTDDLDMTFII